MKIQKYENMQKAMSVIEKDKEFIIIKHVLGQNGEIKKHYHKYANEFLLIPGLFEIMYNGKTSQFDSGSGVALVFIPKNSVHGLKNLGKELAYFVVRDRRDKPAYI